MLIQTKPSAYFYSGSINLSPGKSKDVFVTDLTETELEDIIQAYTLSRLEVGDLDSVLAELRSRKEAGTGGTSSGDPTDMARIDREMRDIKQEIQAMQDAANQETDYVALYILASR